MTTDLEFAIPVSVQDVEESLASWPFRNSYCWECSSRENVSGFGRNALCGGCRASIRLQYRQEADRDREPPDRYNEEE